MKSCTLKEVIDVIMKSQNLSPAHRANATKKLKKYVEQRAIEINSTPKRVLAGVRASITKKFDKEVVLSRCIKKNQATLV
jgi:hypothetical protein